MRPASYSVPGDIRATFIRLVAYIGGLGVLAVAAISFFQGPIPVPAGFAFVPAEPSAPRSAWITAERPFPAFELRMPEFAGSAFSYAQTVGLVEDPRYLRNEGIRLVVQQRLQEGTVGYEWQSL